MLAEAINMTDKDFIRLSRYIENECGIKMPVTKKTMLESRLRKRLAINHINRFSEYLDMVFSANGSDELFHMIDAVTTNKTDFFREPGHFKILTQHVLPEITKLKEEDPNKNIMVWSAGCSTGEEPYTLAIVMNEYVENKPGFEFTILATDISTQVLNIAKQAIYDEKRVEPMPEPMKHKYLLRSKDKEKRLVRIIPALRSRVRFRRLNFMDGDFNMREPLDIIFCRNVIIYFSKETQEALLNKFYKLLRPGGFLFLGHSETINNMDVPFTQVMPTVYRKDL